MYTVEHITGDKVATLLADELSDEFRALEEGHGTLFYSDRDQFKLFEQNRDALGMIVVWEKDKGCVGYSMTMRSYLGGVYYGAVFSLNTDVFFKIHTFAEGQGMMFLYKNAGRSHLAHAVDIRVPVNVDGISEWPWMQEMEYLYALADGKFVLGSQQTWVHGVKWMDYLGSTDHLSFDPTDEFCPKTYSEPHFV